MSEQTPNMYKIIKRDGRVADFDINKIVNAMKKAFVAMKRDINDDMLIMLALRATSMAEKYKENNCVSVEHIQDCVEQVLSEAGYYDVAKDYILYRQQHANVRQAKNCLVDAQKLVDSYLKVEDWRVKENSTVNYSLGGLILGNSGAVTANYWLSQIYDKDIADAHRNVRMHIHDLSMLSGYCFTGDTRVKTLDGKNPTFAELVKDGTDDIWVYAYDPEAQCIVPAKATNPRITRQVTELIEITLTNGKTIRSTPDHPFMLRDGTYIRADQLSPNTSLMPLYIGESSKYVTINQAWHNQEGKVYLHRWIAELAAGRPLTRHDHVHHINGDKHDNRPENLALMNECDHRRQELKLTMASDKWIEANHNAVCERNRSDTMRAIAKQTANGRNRDSMGRFTAFAYSGNKDAKQTAYNHCVRKVQKITLTEPVDVYDLTVDKYHNFAIEGNVFVHNCAGWNLKQLIQEGISGVSGKVSSKPASHLSTLCNQMVNFLGILQNEWAGAQAFSSFDTYLAPFVKVDNLSQKEVKQCIQSFVFGVNTPSRWGCVKDTTKILTPNGWKGPNELHIGDTIFTWVNGVMKEAKLKHLIRHKNDYGVLHQYKGRNYVQTVTPEHRCLVESGTARGSYIVKQSMDIFGARSDIRMPSCIKDVYLTDINDSLTDDEIVLAAMYYTDGTADMDAAMEIAKSPVRDDGSIEAVLNRLELKHSVYNYGSNGGANLNRYSIAQAHKEYMKALIGNKYRIDDKFLHLSAEQSRLFIRTWAAFDGSINGRILCQYDNNDIRDALEIIMLRAGYISHEWSRQKPSDNKPTHYLYADQRTSVVIAEQNEIPYDDDVWCPNTDDGTAIFKDEDGNIFISGNCQAPFTNVTIDWLCPEDLKNLPAIVGGKEMDFTYGDCQKEMDMVNKAFIEIMIEGDANGRGFQYPIPTYSITKDFDWSETENNRLLFEMTAKYGIPYFSNYVNSDMEPSDIRSMAILGTQHLVYKDKFGRISHNEVRHLVDQWRKNPETEYSVLMNGQFVKIIDMFKVPYEKYDNYVQINMANGQSQSFSWDHKCLIVRDGKIIEELAQNIKPSDKILLARHGYKGPDIGSYDAGKIIGYYLAEGWAAHDGAELDFAINDEREDICVEIQKYFEDHFACHVGIDHWVDKHIFKVKVFSKAAVKFVQEFIGAGKAIDKRISCKAYDTSLAFRSGIYDGYLSTDGAAKHNIFAHTTNKALCNDMIALFATIGKYFRYRINDKNTRYFKPDKSDIERFTSYELKILQPEIFNDDYFVVDVSDIALCDAKRIDTVYNFTVDTPEHLYELPNGVITHQCCRLRLDLRELRKKSGGFFGAGESTGSIGVVTLNMPRLAYESETEDQFFVELDKLMDIAARSLKIKRDVITKLLDNGLYPYTKHYLGNFNNHFSTIGLVGMNEAGLNAKWLRKDMTHPETQEFTKKVLNHMRERLSDYQEEYGDLYNLEATPAESTAYRFAKHDKEIYPDIITANENGTPYYTNSSHLPVSYTDDIFSALDIQDELQTLYTSGTVFHGFLGEKLPDWRSAMQLVRKIAENYHLPYYTLSPTYSVCPDHGYLTGEQFTCPHCGKKTEVYSRITGYYRAVQNWNDGKAQEFKDRRTYVPTHSHLNRENHFDAACETNDVPINETSSEELILFTSASCPNCTTAKGLLQKAGVEYRCVLASEEPELTARYNIHTAPTLVWIHAGKIDVMTGVSNIIGFLRR